MPAPAPETPEISTAAVADALDRLGRELQRDAVDLSDHAQAVIQHHPGRGEKALAEAMDAVSRAKGALSSQSPGQG